jgi:hypothetical protein
MRMPSPVMFSVPLGREKVKLEPKEVNWIVWTNVLDEEKVTVHRR